MKIESPLAQSTISPHLHCESRSAVIAGSWDDTCAAGALHTSQMTYPSSQPLRHHHHLTLHFTIKINTTAAAIYTSHMTYPSSQPLELCHHHHIMHIINTRLPFISTVGALSRPSNRDNRPPSAVRPLIGLTVQTGLT